MILDNPGTSERSTGAEKSSISFDTVVSRESYTGNDKGHSKPEPKEQNQNQKQEQGQNQSQGQSTEVSTNIENTNTNKNNNNASSESNSESNSESSSSSSSESSSRSNSSSSSQVGDIDNSSGADATGGSVSIRESNISTFKYYNPSEVHLPPAPPGGNCTVGGGWGVGSILGGFGKNKSKIDKECQEIQKEQFQQNLDFSVKQFNDNMRLQRESLQKNLEAQKETVQKEADTQKRKTDLEKVNSVCDASVDQAIQARETFSTIGDVPGAETTVGAMAHREALFSLQLADMCVTAHSNELGINEPQIELPPLDFENQTKKK